MNKKLQKLTNILPSQFIDRLEKIIPNEKIDSVIEAFISNRPTTFRTNLIKISTSEIIKLLSKDGIDYVEYKAIPNSFILQNLPQKEFTKKQYYTNGYIYIQSLSSMLPVLALNPQPTQKILDLTAAPGSKTTQIASLTNNQCQIVANDKSTIRNYKLEANLNIQGVKNVTLEHQSGQILWKKYPEYFDKTLVDVPCSMEGRININDEKSFEDWSMKKIHFLQEIQKFLLKSAISATKVGGEIIYSTCTLSPEENEEVIDWVLKKSNGAVLLEEITNFDSSLPTSPAILNWNTKIFHPDILKTIRILPSELMEGFYIAKLKKVKTNLPSSMMTTTL